MGAGTHVRSTTVIGAALIACALTTSAAAQQQPTVVDLPLDPVSHPTAISGAPSSAQYCLSGDAANVHSLGWVDAGTGYTVTFDADFKVVSSIGRLDLEQKQTSFVYGSPDLRFTSATAGTMALFVGGAGQEGCYRYKVEITPPSTRASLPTGVRAPAAAAGNAATAGVGVASIAGFASSAKYCLAGTGVAQVHELGRVEQGARVTVTFDSDFNTIAGVITVNLDTQRGTFVVDDDSAGNRQPLIDFNASQSSTLALYVGSVGGSAGCYRYKVDIR